MATPDPPYFSALKGEYGITSWGIFKNYKAKYIDTSAFRPVIHVMAAVCIIGYMMEFPHLRRKHRPLPLLLGQSVHAVASSHHAHDSSASPHHSAPPDSSHGVLASHASCACFPFDAEQTSATRRSASVRSRAATIRPQQGQALPEWGRELYSARRHASMCRAAPRPVPSETAPGRSDTLEALVSLDGLALAEPYFDVSCRGEEVFRSTGSYYG